MTVRRAPRLAWLGIALAAMMLTLVSAMIHGSHADARLLGPDGWTEWVTLDVVLVALPVVTPMIVFPVLRVTGLDRRASMTGALTVWLMVAGISCVLAAFWI